MSNRNIGRSRDSFRQNTHSLPPDLSSKDGKKYEEILTFQLFDGTYTTNQNNNYHLTKKQEKLLMISPHRILFPLLIKKKLKGARLPPYTTSTLQQDAGRKLYYSSKKTMQLAQKLYEEGYHYVSPYGQRKFFGKIFIANHVHISKKRTERQYVPDDARRFQTKSKVAQEAHEAITTYGCGLTT